MVITLNQEESSGENEKSIKKTVRKPQEKVIVVIWVVISSSTVGRHQRFVAMYHLHLQKRNDTFLRNGVTDIKTAWHQHGTTTQKILTNIFTAVKISNLSLKAEHHLLDLEVDKRIILKRI